jgi:hypothetical protein
MDTLDPDPVHGFKVSSEIDIHVSACCFHSSTVIRKLFLSQFSCKLIYFRLEDVTEHLK